MEEMEPQERPRLLNQLMTGKQEIGKFFRKNKGVSGFVLGFFACAFLGDTVEEYDISIPGFSARGGQSKDDHTILEEMWASDDAYAATTSTDSERTEVEMDKNVRRVGLLAWLAGKGIYPPDDRRIVTAIEGLCEAIPDSPLKEHLEKSEACAKLPVPAALRKLSEAREPPFHRSGVLVTIGVPGVEADRPNKGQAHTCFNGGWLDRMVKLTDLSERREVTVSAEYHYGRDLPCDDEGTVPTFQLSEEDAVTLLGLSTDKIERAIAKLVVVG